MSDDEKLVRRVTETLDRSVADLDGATRSRLAQARAKALEGRRRPLMVWWIPAGGAVFATLLVAALWIGRAPAPENEGEPGDFEMLTSVDVNELGDDLEFYQWLAQEGPDAG